VIATGIRFKKDKIIESMVAHHQLSKRVCFNPGVVPTSYGKVVAVVGGGDNALGTVLMLADTSKPVHLFVRSQLRGFKLNRTKKVFLNI